MKWTVGIFLSFLCVVAIWGDDFVAHAGIVVGGAPISVTVCDSTYVASESEPAASNGGLVIVPQAASCTSEIPNGYVATDGGTPVVDGAYTHTRYQIERQSAVVGAPETAVNNIAVSAVEDIVPEGGLVPSGRDGNYEAVGYGSCEFVTLINNLIRFLIGLSLLLAVIIFMYAGYLMVYSRGDMGQIQQAKGLLLNVIIGLVILLSAFLIINTILSILVGSTSSIMNWQTVKCSYATQSAKPEKIDITLTTEYINARIMSADENVYPDAVLRSLPSGYTAGDCSPENLAKYGMTRSQAETFSCLALPESGCNLNAQNGWTSARGVFQIVRGLNDTCHNLNVPECTAAARAAGYAVSGDLNCSQAFTGGTSPGNPSRARSGMQDRFDACNAAASNLGCNTAAALCLYNDGGGYRHWTADPRSSRQKACVAKFGN